MCVCVCVCVYTCIPLKCNICTYVRIIHVGGYSLIVSTHVGTNWSVNVASLQVLFFCYAFCNMKAYLIMACLRRALCIPKVLTGWLVPMY